MSKIQDIVRKVTYSDDAAKEAELEIHEHIAACLNNGKQYYIEYLKARGQLTEENDLIVKVAHDFVSFAMGGIRLSK